MKKLISISLIFTLIFPSVSFALQDKNEEKLIEQQLEIYESKRELSNIYSEIKNIESSLPKIKENIKKQKEKNKIVKERTKKMLVALQQREPNYVLTMLVSADDFWEFVEISELLIIIFQNQKELLQQYTDEEEKLNDMLNTMKSDKKRLIELKEYHINKLKKLGITEVQLKEELSKSENGEEIKRVGEELVRKWEKEGLETFEMFFSSLTKTMNSLPQHFDKNNMKSVGFFKRSVTIEEDEINNMLSKDKLLKNVKIKFKPEQLIVYGYYNDTTLIIFGNYELTKEHNLVFNIEKMIFNGYELPEFTIKQMEERYDLGIYPEKLIKSVKIRDFKIKKGKIEIEVGMK